MTTTKSRTEHERSLSQFAGLRVRVRSLDFARDEVRRCQADGEEILAHLADPRPSGDPWMTERARAAWHELLDESIEAYHAEFRKLCWELEDTGIV